MLCCATHNLQVILQTQRAVLGSHHPCYLSLRTLEESSQTSSTSISHIAPSPPTPTKYKYKPETLSRSQTLVILDLV